MAFTDTTSLIETLRTRLCSLPLDAVAGVDQKLFQRVGVFGANRLVEAMKSVFASESRVCFIVPGGDDYAATRDRSLLFNQRTTRLALLIADQALDTEKTAALIGGTNALGILPMKDLVIQNLTAVPFTGPDLAFVPSTGEPLVITAADKPANNLGRECWLQWLAVYAGTTRQAIS